MQASDSEEAVDVFSERIGELLCNLPLSPAQHRRLQTLFDRGDERIASAVQVLQLTQDVQDFADTIERLTQCEPAPSTAAAAAGAHGARAGKPLRALVLVPSDSDVAAAVDAIATLVSYGCSVSAALADAVDRTAVAACVPQVALVPLAACESLAPGAGACILYIAYRNNKLPPVASAEAALCTRSIAAAAEHLAGLAVVGPSRAALVPPLPAACRTVYESLESTPTVFQALMRLCVDVHDA